MRHSIPFTLVSVLAITACSTYSATHIDVADAGPQVGGKSSTGGTVNGGSSSTAGAPSAGGSATQASANAGGANIGGISSQAGASTGGSSSLGGSSATSGGASTSSGGASSTGGVAANGGMSASGGASVSTGGKSSTGGTSAVVGGMSSTGGASGCTKDADCVNLDPTNCSYTCTNPGTSGVCKPTAALTPTQCATSACDDKPISGFWDASGKPHIAYAWTETDGTASIRMQQVKADGTADGAAVTYRLPAGQHEPGLLSAGALGNAVAFLFTSSIAESATVTWERTLFSLTDVAGTSSVPAELERHSNPRLTSLRLVDSLH